MTGMSNPLFSWLCNVTPHTPRCGQVYTEISEIRWETQLIALPIHLKLKGESHNE